jgi:GAF domain-containing protein
MAKPAFDEIVLEIGAFAETAKDFILLQKFCVRINAESLSHYNWVGFYMLDPGDENVLVLGPYHGASTEHVRIPVTEGICGTAVAQGETVIVDVLRRCPRDSPTYSRN